MVYNISLSIQVQPISTIPIWGGLTAILDVKLRYWCLITVWDKNIRFCNYNWSTAGTLTQIKVVLFMTQIFAVCTFTKNKFDPTCEVQNITTRFFKMPCLGIPHCQPKYYRSFTWTNTRMGTLSFVSSKLMVDKIFMLFEFDKGLHW